MTVDVNDAGRLRARFRPAMYTYVLFSVLIGGFLIYAVAGAVVIHRSLWPLAGILGALYAFVILWLQRFRIDVTDTAIVLTSLFGGEQRMLLSDVEDIRTAWEPGRGLQGPMRLIVQAKRGTRRHRLTINAKVFQRDIVAELRRAAGLEPLARRRGPSHARTSGDAN